MYSPPKNEHFANRTIGDGVLSFEDSTYCFMVGIQIYQNSLVVPFQTVLVNCLTPEGRIISIITPPQN